MRRCHECGSNNIGSLNLKGREFPYKDAKLVLDIDLFVERGCKDCGEFGMWHKEIINLDIALEPIYKKWKNQ